MELPARLRRTAKTDPARLCGLTGPPYDRAQLEASEFLVPDRIDGIRAYPVPSLVGLSVVAPDEQDLYEVLEALLRDRVCGFAWRVQPRIEEPMRQYGLLHTSLDGPPSPADGPAMWLELSGTVVAFGGEPLGGRGWFEVRTSDMGRARDLEIPGPIEVRIDVATYANERYPGVGVPFHL